MRHNPPTDPPAGSDPGLDETRVGDPSLVTSSPTRRARRLAKGEVVGRFVVVDELGEGGMGTVYAVYDPELDRRLALKILRPRKDDLELATARLRREAQAMAKLAHPNVVAVHDIGTHEGQLWVAMDFVEGQTLRDWMETGAQPFDAVWERFEPAALGLAAAHEVGLVHRDFKPANVLLGERGRVQVADFGLARLDGEAEEAGAPALPEAVSLEGTQGLRQSGVSLSTRVTRTGAFVGTPAYMAPEQFSGGTIDARTDQFAFAVAMWEALCGERPFAGDSANSVMFNVVQGQLREPPRGVSMPRRVRAALTQALSVDPDARFGNMGELLEALAPPRRAWMWPAAAALVGLGVTAFLAGRGPDEAELAAERCAVADPRLEALWSPARRQALVAKLASIEASWAEDVAEAALSGIDAWVPKYAEARREACEATRVSGVQSEEMLDRRMLCLDRRVRRLDALVQLFEAADQKTLRRAESMVRQLDDLEACADRETLLSRVAPPADPKARAEVERLEGEVERAWTLRIGGRPEAAEAVARAAMEAADALGHAPLQAEARYELGRVRSDREAEPEARALLERGFTVALAAGEDRMAARSAAALVTSAETLEDRAESDTWFGIAEAILQRIGNPPGVRAMLLMNRGNALGDRGDLEGELAAHEQAHRLYTERYGERSMFAADALYNTSSTLWQLGRYAEAAKRGEEALEIWREHVGASHPRITQAMRALAVFELQAGNDRAALDMQREVVARTEAESGPESAALASALSNLGAVATQSGLFEVAAEALERARKIYELRGEGKKVAAGYVLGNLAKAYLGAGKLEQATEAAQAAFEIMREDHDGPHMDQATILVMRGEIREAQGSFAEAEADFAAAKALIAQLRGADFPDLLEVHVALARTALAREDLGAAEAELERAASLAAAGEAGPLYRGDMHRAAWRLARAKGESAAAEEALRSAREAYGEAGRAGELRIDELLKAGAPPAAAGSDPE